MLATNRIFAWGEGLKRLTDFSLRITQEVVGQLCEKLLHIFEIEMLSIIGEPLVDRPRVPLLSRGIKIAIRAILRDWQSTGRCSSDSEVEIAVNRLPPFCDTHKVYRRG